MTVTQEPDEMDVREYIFDYAEEKRLAPARSNELLEKALKPTEPEEPEPDECCGSKCCPCVRDLWQEEVAVWKAVRNIK